MANEKRKHTATRWYGTGPIGGQSGLYCNGCDWTSGHEGTRRDQEERHRQHRRDVGEHPAERKNTRPVQLVTRVKLDDLAEQLAEQLDDLALLDLIGKVDHLVGDCHFTSRLVTRLLAASEEAGCGEVVKRS